MDEFIHTLGNKMNIFLRRINFCKILKKKQDNKIFNRNKLLAELLTKLDNKIVFMRFEA